MKPRLVASALSISSLFVLTAPVEPVEAAGKANDALAWTLVVAGTAQGTMILDKNGPLNPRNPTSLRLDM